ncbi:hypothetical protein SAMN05216456_1928 [Devosia crocina]|uniref:Uncharacterized protein n=1 Tax=Devosia crocina TaxID=429728 RepID=A0A1I7NF53_9HYPH|nr:hypothetical protein [Devosia crocina]SFV33233.1 hypothetical protein SAMN05216456_1928 [Devosia crocina]
MSQLALYESAKEALAAAVRVDEVVDIRNMAEQAKAYAKIARDRRLQADAQELGARAERKLGILLRKAKANGEMSLGGRPAQNSNLDDETGAAEEPVFDNTTFTLAEIGISKKLSSRAQHLAELADDDFERVISDKREKTLAADAPIVSPPKKKPVKADKPAPVQPLEPRRWHQFAFSVLTLSMASDRVSSEAVLKLAEFCGIAALDGDTVDFTPEAIKAMGSLADVALRALDGETELPGTANDCPQPLDTDQRLSAAGPKDAAGRQSVDTLRAERGRPGDGVTAGQTAPDFLERARLREAYEGEIALLLPHKGKLTKQTAEAAMRAGYAAEVPLAIMCQDLGHPYGTVATWANRLGLTSRNRMLAHQYRAGGEA